VTIEPKLAAQDWLKYMETLAGSRNESIRRIGFSGDTVLTLLAHIAALNDAFAEQQRIDQVLYGSACERAETAEARTVEQIAEWMTGPLPPDMAAAYPASAIDACRRGCEALAQCIREGAWRK
jgi:hypothetical protein